MLDLLPEWRAANMSLENALVLDGDWIPADDGGVPNALPNPAMATLAKSPYSRRLPTSSPTSNTSKWPHSTVRQQVW